MAKIIDITEKLSFEEPPKIVVKGKELELKYDAATVLKIMGALGDGAGTPKQVMDTYNLIFQEKSRKTIDKLGLNFKDFKILIQSAIGLIIGEDEDNEGEEETRTTT